MSESKVRSWAIFTIRGSIAPDQITRELSIDPDRVYEEGKDRVWQLNSKLGATESTEAHFNQLLERLLPNRSALRKIAAEHYTEFFCFLEKPAELTIPITLSPRILLLCGYLRAHIDVEVKDIGVD